MAGSRLRHRCVPFRAFGDWLIVARPIDGAATILEPTAAVVWRQLDDWTTQQDIDRSLAHAFPTVSTAERLAARIQILEGFRADDLVERS